MIFQFSKDFGGLRITLLGSLPQVIPSQNRFHQSRRELVFTFFSGRFIPYHLLLPESNTADIAATPNIMAVKPGVLFSSS